ncbi:MAG: hypothetical protein C0404_03625 [Verrucomicrobia bacterium]|nr:hypothetical protein [Verrucomicrobiota bacterium]
MLYRRIPRVNIMKFFRSGTWGYAVLLIVLFSIAALAARATIVYVGDHVSGQPYEVITILVWALSLGFMFIAGAFGLWAIQFSAIAEGRRRIGRFVDAMDYLSDGIVAVDSRGRVTGSNPSVNSLSGTNVRSGQRLGEIFTSLSEEDVHILLDSDSPNEVERDHQHPSGARNLRFRSQPSEGLILVVVSDITAKHTQAMHIRQMARLQLIGQLARGVAHDFNNLLCGISGYASLLTRIRPGSPEAEKSLASIQQSTERGIALAGHLAELAQTNYAMHPTDAIREHIEAALEVLRGSLVADWKTETSVDDDIPPTSLTGIQLEQIITNLGLLVVDSSPAPATLHVVARRPGKEPLFKIDDSFAGAVVLHTGSVDMLAKQVETSRNTSAHDSGVIQSVIRSIIEENGGRLDCFLASDGSNAFRLALPRGALYVDASDATKLPDELKAYVGTWSVLMAMPGREQASLEKRMLELGIKVHRVNNVMSALAMAEDNKLVDTMVLHKYLLGSESKSLLKAVMKLHPSAGIVVLCEDPQVDSEDMAFDIVFLDTHAGPDKILISLIEAKNLAMRRIHNPGSVLSKSAGR